MSEGVREGFGAFKEVSFRGVGRCSGGGFEVSGSAGRGAAGCECRIWGRVWGEALSVSGFWFLVSGFGCGVKCLAFRERLRFGVCDSGFWLLVKTMSHACPLPDRSPKPQNPKP